MKDSQNAKSIVPTQGVASGIFPDSFSLQGFDTIVQEFGRVAWQRIEFPNNSLQEVLASRF